MPSRSRRYQVSDGRSRSVPALRWRSSPRMSESGQRRSCTFSPSHRFVARTRSSRWFTLIRRCSASSTSPTRSSGTASTYSHGAWPYHPTGTNTRAPIPSNIHAALRVSIGGPS